MNLTFSHNHHPLDPLRLDQNPPEHHTFNSQSFQAVQQDILTKGIKTQQGDLGGQGLLHHFQRDPCR